MFLSSCGGKKSQPNILLVTIDTLRRDHIGVYGYSRETSPFIDELARKGVRYQHVITPISATSASHASILTSLHPITHNVIHNGNFLSHEVQTLAEVLKQKGYYTIGAVAVKILSAKYNFSQGFDSFSDQWRENDHFNLPTQRTAQSVNESLFKQIAAYLTKHKEKPLFIWVHYYDPHMPYREIDHITFKTKLRRTRNWEFKDRYDKEIRYTDEHIKKLYNHLEETGIARKMVTCITADHGEQFGEHGYYNCHADFYSETILVPLIFQGYGIPRNKVVEEYFSTMDIPVTLLGLVDLSFEHPAEGIDLLKTGNKPGMHKDRNFLIIGYPVFTRSLQLLKYPFAFILNFDYFFKYWFISGQNSIPGARFKPVHKRYIKKTGNNMSISLPPSRRRGLHYAVIRIDIKKSNGMSIQSGAVPGLIPGKVRIGPGIKHINIIYPAVIRTRISFNLELDNGTAIEKPAYTFISKKEMDYYFKVKQKIRNEIFDRFKTPRKEKKGDELFKISHDIGMTNNLADSKKAQPIIIEYQKILYNILTFYYEKKNKILKGTSQKKDLTREQKKTLKSLGYL